MKEKIILEMDHQFNEKRHPAIHQILYVYQRFCYW